MLGKFLKEKRIEAGLSQKEVSDKMGWKTYQMVSNNERGMSNPPMKSISKLAKLYKIEASDIAEHMRVDEIKRINKKYSKFIK